MFPVLKCITASKLPAFAIINELHKVNSRTNVLKYQVVTLTRAAYRDESEVPIIKPFPYHKKQYTLFRLIFDTWKNRLHKHNKMIVVEGPVASGKVRFAKELAAELDFLFLPEPNFNDFYTMPSGLDVRTLDSRLPEELHTWDIERYLHNPQDKNTAMMQLHMYYMRQQTYMHGLIHMICAGQGVVTIRSPWTDKAFTKTMYLNKHISKEAYHYILDCYDVSLMQYLKPHLIIYLDTPVKKTLENIEKNGEPYEKNAPALTEKFLSDYEKVMKTELLPYLKIHCLQLIYEWTGHILVQEVLSDIEQLNFEDYNETIKILRDWRYRGQRSKLMAYYYSVDHFTILSKMEIPTLIPELTIKAENLKAFIELFEDIGEPTLGSNFPKPGHKPILTYYDDNVTPLMKKYEERKRAYFSKDTNKTTEDVKEC